MRQTFCALGIVLVGCGGTISQPASRAPSPSAPKSLDRFGTADDDLELAVPRLLHTINAARVEQGSAPLEVDATLCLVARQAARRYSTSGRDAGQRIAAAVNDELGRFFLVYRRVVTTVAYLPSVTVAARSLAAASDPKMTCAGIAVERIPEGSGLAVVVILASSLSETATRG